MVFEMSLRAGATMEAWKRENKKGLEKWSRMGHEKALIKRVLDRNREHSDSKLKD